MCANVTDARTFIADLLKIVDFIDWQKVYQTK